jgi:hypothetical protein
MGVNHCPESFLITTVVVVAYLHTRHSRVEAAREQHVDTSHDVTHLAFGVVDDAGSVDGIGAWTEHAEEVREARDGDAQIGVCGIAPRLIEFHAVEAADVDGSELVVDVETGGPDQNVGRPVHAVAGRHAVGGDLRDPIVDQFDIVALQCGEPGSVVLQGPLAHRRVIRRDLSQQFLVVAKYPHPGDEHLADRMVRLAGREPAVVPLRVDPHLLVECVGDRHQETKRDHRP